MVSTEIAFSASMPNILLRIILIEQSKTTANGFFYFSLKSKTINNN
jgi:hypothetical protein